MKTILIWLLVSVGRHGEVHVAERFAVKEECERVRLLLPYEGNWQRPQVRCIQAHILVAPHG